jgi:hypothetical protein
VASIHIVTLAKDDRSGLSATRRSIEGQVGPSISHHLVIAPSRDGTEQLADELSASAGVTIWRDSPPGIYASMNWILDRLPPEDFVWFLNAGDVLVFSGALEAMCRALDESGVEWCTSSFLVATRSGWIRNVVRASEPWMPRDVGHQATVARVSLLLDAGGFPPVPPILADAALLRRIMQTHKPAVVPLPTVLYTLGGYSSRHPFQTARDVSWLDRHVPLHGQSAGFHASSARPSLRQLALPLATELESLVPRWSAALLRPRGARRLQIANELATAPHWSTHPNNPLSRACCVAMI